MADNTQNYDAMLSQLGVGAPSQGAGAPNYDAMLSQLGVNKPTPGIMDQLKSGAVGVGQGVYNFGANVVSKALNLPQIGGGTIGGDVAKWYDANQAVNQAAQAKYAPGTAGDIGRAVGGAAPYLGLGGGEMAEAVTAKAIGTGESMIAKLVGNTAQGATTGALAAQNGQSGQGAGIGAGIGAGLTGAGGAVGKLAGALISKSPNEVDAMLAAEKAAPGFAATMGQLTGNPIAKGVENVAGNIPVIGDLFTGGKANAAAIKDAAEQLINSKGDINDINSKLVQSVADHKDALDQQSKILYNKFTDLAKTSGPVPMTETQLEMARQGAKLETGSSFPGFMKMDITTPAIDRLNDMITTLHGASGGGNAINPDVVKTLRTLVNTPASDMEEPEKNLVNGVSAALEKDLANYAANSGNPALINSYKDASSFYKSNIVPFTADTKLKAIIQNGYNSDNLFKTFIKNDAPKTAGKLVNNLTDDGKQALQGHVLNKAFQKSTDPINGTFDPIGFMSKIEKLGTTQDVVFDPETLSKLKGLSILIKTAAPSLKPTALQSGEGIAAGLAGAGALAMNPGSAGLAATLGMLAKAGTSPTAAKLLIKASRMNVGSDVAKRTIAGITAATMNEEDSK
jgi:hypothetical protein